MTLTRRTLIAACVLAALTAPLAASAQDIKPRIIINDKPYYDLNDFTG